MAVPQTWFCAAIEAAAGCEVYPLAVPEGVSLPFVVYRRASTIRNAAAEALDGSLVEGDSFNYAAFDVQIYADGYLAAWAIADAVRAAMNPLFHYEGEAPGDSRLTEEADGEPVFFDGQDKPTYVVDQTYQVRWLD